MYCSKKNKPTFGYAHFPIGTVFTFKVSGVDKVEHLASVRELVKNGPDSYLIHTNLACELTDYRMINASHVTGIVRRGPGVAKISIDRKTRHQHNWEILPSSRTHYRTHSLRSLLNDHITAMAGQDHIVDVDKMIYMLTQQNVVQFIHYNCDEFGIHYGYTGYHKVSKKKLKAAIKRVYNKCLCDHGEAQRESDQMWDDPKGWGYDEDY